MTGLESIIEQILEHAQTTCDEILADANKQADQIISQAKAAADAKLADFHYRDQLKAKELSKNAQSTAELKKRQTLLKARQALISQLKEKAYQAVLNLPEEDYFELLSKLIKIHAQARDGILLLNEKDLARAPKVFEETANRLAAENGGSLHLSKDTVSIDGGFVLSYGGIQENCSMEAIFHDKNDALTDAINQYLTKS